jgi:hypothetical protein
MNLMNRFRRSSLVAVCLASLSMLPVLAQTPAAAPSADPASAPASGQPHGPRPNPTNIKALPKHISGDDLIKLMHQYEGDLGVGCSYCHVQNVATKHTDFPSDAKPAKNKARVMIKMTDDLNKKYLTRLKDRKSTDAITCGTCHRGMAVPAVYIAPKRPSNRPAGAAPAVQ